MQKIIDEQSLRILGNLVKRCSDFIQVKQISLLAMI